MSQKVVNTAKAQQQLDMLAKEIVEQDICAELKAQATQLVKGEGSATADIVFIGEAPGKREDILGKPFIGAAGTFLSEMLSLIGLARETVYITNIVKYRPPNNRDPSPQEKADFWPYLVRELQIVRPKVVVTLGRHSMGYFLPGAVISEVHGQPKRVQLDNETIMVMPLFHPAAALYNGSLRQTLIDDFKQLPHVITEELAVTRRQ